MCLPVQDWVSLRTSVLGDEVRNVKPLVYQLRMNLVFSTSAHSPCQTTGFDSRIDNQPLDN